MFDPWIENNRGASWGSVMPWAERSWLLEISETNLSFAHPPSREPPKASRAFRAILARFKGNKTKQNQTQRQQPIEDLHKLSKAELLEI
jgi:hypothetical protein